MRCFVFSLALIFAFHAGNTNCQTIDPDLPCVVEKNGRHALMVDGKPFLILGGQAHNSSAWPEMMSGVWDAIEYMHANTLEIPVYWEQIESQPGKYDFSLTDTILKQSRAHNVHVVLLWFATWKNGSNHYMPEWMKKDAGKYPNITGKDGKPVDSPSPHCKDAMEADAKAFAAFMSYLKKVDRQHTVIMVQVQNEPGSWGSVRDYSPQAQKIFDGQVPAILLKPEILKALNKPIVQQGTWKEVFGSDADEYFHAWAVANYIEYVASAGKAVYPLPLYTNVALRDPLSNPPAGSYESGGATDNVIPIWKATAPSLSILAPDIYLPESEKALKVIELYDRPDNPLFVPEIGGGPVFSKYLYPVIAHGGIGFSPFGIDNNGSMSSVAEMDAKLGATARDYAMINPMMREITQWAFDGKIKSVVEADDHAAQTIHFDQWEAHISFGPSGRNRELTNKIPIGKAVVVQFNDNEFLLSGALCHFTFSGAGKNTGKAWQYLKVEEGKFENGSFKLCRIRNGDETDWGGPSIGETPLVLRVSLVTR